MSSHTIFVYADLQGVSHRVGTLWTRHHRGKESVQVLSMLPPGSLILSDLR